MARSLSGSLRNIRQLLGIRVRVHGTVAVHQHTVFHEHQEYRRHNLGARAGLNELQRGANRVRGRIDSARDHAIRKTLVNQHRTEIRGIAHTLTRALNSHALVRTQLSIGCRKILTVFVIRNVDNANRGRQVNTLSLADFRDLIRVAQQNQVTEIAARNHLGGTQNTHIVALRQNHGTAVRAGGLNQVVQESQRGHRSRALKLKT